MRRRLVGLVVLGVLAVASVAHVPPAAAATITYSAEETIPVPPASSFQGSGGGDGWAVALTATKVLNVHHHNSTITVACRNQSDASQCWTSPTKTVTDDGGGTFATLHPGLHLDLGSGRLYVYATRNSDNVGGVVCIDTSVQDAVPNPFCGFAALTQPGQAPYGFLTNGVSLGSRFYAANFGNGGTSSALCFDVTTASACAGQPYALDVPVSSSANTISAVGSRVYVPSSGSIGCFDAQAGTECAGSWPVSALTGYGAPFPLLDAAGYIVGVCNPDGSVHCFDLAGALVATPTGLGGTVGYTQYWNGPAFTLGSRVYVPSGTTDTIDCYDYATGQQCPNFPHAVPGASYLYTVNPDPARPSCIWINADGGSAQIQNFDAFSGLGCGEGPVRVLASSIVVNSPKCIPTTYTSLAILDPARQQYRQGSVAFENGSGYPIPGMNAVSIDAAGVADLRGLALNTNAGLPQFLITLEDPVGTPGSVTVRLTWTGEHDPGCDPGSNGNSGTVVSFGDSIAAGEGSGPHTGYPNNPNAYSGVIGARLGWTSYNFAISGACTATSGKGGAYGTPSECTKSILTDELPAAAAMNLRPDLVTVTVGANDIRFSSCVVGVLGFEDTSPCTGTLFTDHLRALKSNLGTVVSRIRDMYGPEVPIALTRYFSPVPGYVAPPAPVCAVMPALALAKIYKDQGGWAAAKAVKDVDNRARDYQGSVSDKVLAIIGRLNKTLTDAAQPYHVTLVALNFSGHDFCTDYDGHADAWVFAPYINVFASYYGAGGATYERELTPAHRCVEKPECDTTTKFVNESGTKVGQRWTFIATFLSNDFPHLTKPGQEEVASRIIAATGVS